MEVNIETAVRICPLQCNNGDTVCVQANPYNNTIQLGHSHPYPVNYVLQHDCPQNTVFNTSVLPLLNFLLEGCDVSVVTIGQAGMGKSYTLVGPGLSCTLSESEYGIIPRFLRELFARVSESRDRNTSVLITWSQICGENVQDLLGAGSVECKSISEAFQYIQIGMTNIAPRYVHTLFTVTLEQQWIFNNTIQHRISTASFADLCGSEKIIIMDNSGVPQSVPSDSGLLNLQRCVMALTEPITNQFSVQIPYNQSVLTTLLKDSFGGRAKTLLICCISPLLRDLSETFYTLQFAIRAQLIKNIVTVNSYTTNEKIQENCDVFGLQFAANQLFKLVSNAEELFQRLVANNSLSKQDLEQVSQWLTLKQECEECLSETSEPRRSLERIEEEIEDDSDSSESEEENEDIINRLTVYMESFRINADALVSKANALDNHLHSTTKESGNSLNSEFHNKGARGRRNSIHSAEEFSSPSLSVSQKIDEETNEDEKSPPSYENKKRMLKEVTADLQGCQKQITELENTIEMKEKLMQQLLKHKTIKTSARDKMELKLSHLKLNHEEVTAKLEQPVNEEMIDKCKQELAEIELKIKDIDSIKNITEDGSRRVMELESSLHTSKKQLDKLKKLKRKDEKRKLILENELKTMHKKKTVVPEIKSLVVPDSWIDVCKDVSPTNDKLESLRHEIRNLRRTRELLLEQRCKIDSKSYLKIVNELEERKLIQYEEAIEAIDLAIEYKNELMCGHEDMNQKALAVPQDPTDKMLLERLMKLNEHEMRALLYKYFEKVVDLRSNSKKLEIQVVDMDCQNENLTSRVQSLSHTLQQVRLEGERRILSLQQQHEDKLHIVMRHIASDGGDSRVVSRVLERSKQAALAMQVAGASKHVDKSSFIARFSRYARHETVPRQLQASAAPPQAKVTRQKNKLIITQNKI